MEMFPLILKFFAGLILLFGFGWLIGQLTGLDDYLSGYKSDKSSSSVPHKAKKRADAHKESATI